MKQWGFWIRLVLVGIVIGSLAVPLVYCTFGPGPTDGSVEVAAQLESARLLYERAVPFPVGPFMVTVTPFQLVYVVVSLLLLFVGLLVCLTRCLCSRYVRYFHLPRKSKIASMFM